VAFCKHGISRDDRFLLLETTLSFIVIGLSLIDDIFVAHLDVLRVVIGKTKNVSD